LLVLNRRRVRYFRRQGSVLTSASPPSLKLRRTAYTAALGKIEMARQP
jgi:hypothetical protein